MKTAFLVKVRRVIFTLYHLYLKAFVRAFRLTSIK